jgi:N-acetylglucosaminyl-diphospho-decaprenol L-rhamnosyltransferase
LKTKFGLNIISSIMDQLKDISVIIPIYNRIDISKIGLNYISKSIQFYHSQLERANNINLIIVDDGSTDGSSEWISKTYPEAIILKGSGQLWWTGSVNMGIEYARNNFPNLDAIILQNDDIVVEDTWLDYLIQTANLNPNSLIGCITANFKNKNLVDYGGRKLHPWFSYETKINKGKPTNSFPRGHVEKSYDLYGRGLFIPINVFKKTGLFNSLRFKHRGDMDIPLRAKKAGFNLLVSYDAIVYDFPELTYSLDTKKHLSIKEIFRLLTDFRSSSNVKFIYYYSKIATNNALQFLVFLSSNAYFQIRRLSWKYLSQFISK